MRKRTAEIQPPVQPRQREQLSPTPRLVLMVHASGAASPPREAPPPLETVNESSTSSGELQPTLVLAPATLVTGIVREINPSATQLSLELDRGLVEPISTLRMSTPKSGASLEIGERITGLEVVVAQQARGSYMVRFGANTLRTGVPSPPTTRTVAAEASNPQEVVGQTAESR